MSRKEKFDGCMRQAEFAFNSFHTRRAYEWKVTLGFWAATVLATQFLYDKPLNFRCIVWICAPMVIVIFHGLFLWGMRRAGKTDKDVYEKFREYAIEVLAGREPTDIKLPSLVSWWSWDLFDWSQSFQLATTLALAVGSSWLLASKP